LFGLQVEGLGSGFGLVEAHACLDHGPGHSRLQAEGGVHLLQVEKRHWTSGLHGLVFFIRATGTRMALQHFFELPMSEFHLANQGLEVLF